MRAVEIKNTACVYIEWHEERGHSYGPRNGEAGTAKRSAQRPKGRKLAKERGPANEKGERERARARKQGGCRGGKSGLASDRRSSPSISVSFKAAFISRAAALTIGSLACLEFKTTRPNCYVRCASPSSISLSLSRFNPPSPTPSFRFVSFRSIETNGVRRAKGKLRASLSASSARREDAR